MNIKMNRLFPVLVLLAGMLPHSGLAQAPADRSVLPPVAPQFGCTITAVKVELK
jgi:hypothetical protein